MPAINGLEIKDYINCHPKSNLSENCSLLYVFELHVLMK